jgi:hypothetical protein
MSEYVCGLDLGQSVDFSVFTAVQCHRSAEAPATYCLEGMQRFALGLPYTEIAEAVAERMKAPPLKGSRLVIDAGGPGRPVFDIFQREEISAALVPVTITGGRQVNATRTGLCVPKGHLISVLIALFQEGRLEFAKVEGRDILVAELKAFKVRQTATGHETFAGERSHDDAVVSLAMAVWLAEAAANLYPGATDLARVHGLRAVVPGRHGLAAARNIFGMGAFRP